MPYEVLDQKDGEPVGYRAVRDQDDADNPTLVFDAIPEDAVWDATSMKPRQRTATELLQDAKDEKEAELRDAANNWYRQNVRGFEGAIVVGKYGRGGLTALSAEERTVFDSMNANYTKLKSLVASVRSAANVAEVEGISW